MHIQFKKRLFLCTAAALACLLVLMCFTARQQVLVMAVIGSDQAWELPLTERRFSLCFTHSVMKTPVEEVYTVKADGTLVLVETIYRSYGVGLPFLPEEGELMVEGGVFTLKLNRSIEKLSLTIAPLANHYLKIGGETYHFNDLLGNKSARISFSTRERLVWSWRGTFDFV